MPEITTLTPVQLTNPQDPSQGWLPVTLAELVNMPSGSTLLQELGTFLKMREYSVTGSAYVQEVSVNEAGTQLMVKTWAKDANGTLTSQSIDIVGENTTYTLTAERNTATTGSANSHLFFSGSDGVTSSIQVPVGALVDDDDVELIIDGRFN